MKPKQHQKKTMAPPKTVPRPQPKRRAADLAYDAIETLLTYLEQRPQVGIAGSAIYGTDDEPHTTAFRFPSVWSELEPGLSLGMISKLLARNRVSSQRSHAARYRAEYPS